MSIMVRNEKALAVRVVTTLAAVVVLGGCAMKGDVRLLQDEIRALAARQDSLLTELRAQTLSTQDTIRTQTDQMFDFRGDINQSIRQISQSLARLEALAGENQRGITQVRDQIANMRRSPGATTAPARPDSMAGGGDQLVAGAAGNPDAVWSAAVQQYERESYRAATAAFEQFIADFPSDARAAQGHYYLADILETQGRPEDALEEFRRLPSLYPTSEWVPNAMYRGARLVLEHVGDAAEAKAILERIVNTYPGTPTASLARDLLEEIG